MRFNGNKISTKSSHIQKNGTGMAQKAISLMLAMDLFVNEIQNDTQHKHLT
jgi:hypothetical protein